MKYLIEVSCGKCLTVNVKCHKKLNLIGWIPFAIWKISAVSKTE